MDSEEKMKAAEKFPLELTTFSRDEWTPPSLKDSNKLIRQGCERIGKQSFVRLVRWDTKRRGWVLEALIRSPRNYSSRPERVAKVLLQKGPVR